MKEVSLYLHIPFCVKKCDYCDFLSGAYDNDIQKRYAESLCKEIAYMGQQLRSVAVSSIYIGGGTPSWLDASDMGKIMDALHKNYTIGQDAEISMECNPGTVTMEKFSAYRKMGINRLSIGLQSANDDELRLLGRIHSYEQFLRTFDMARKSGFYNLNVDIMTGLPRQTPEKLMHTLEQVIALRPEHVSAYSLIVEEGTPFYDRYKFDAVKQHAGMKTEFLPDEDEEYRLSKMAQSVLIAHGYQQYEISNYARKGYACYHNTVYWRRGDYLGLGIGAASMVSDRRMANVRDIYQYMDLCADKLYSNNIEETENLTSPLWQEVTSLSKKDAMEEFMFLGLRMNVGVTREDFAKCFSCSIESVYGEAIKHLRQEALLEVAEGRIFLTDKGMDLSNYALAHFLL